MAGRLLHARAVTVPFNRPAERSTLARAGVALALLIIVVVCAGVLRASFRRPMLRAGDALPAVDIRTADGSVVALNAAHPGVLIVMLSDDACEFCPPQLNTFEAAVDDFRDGRLYIIRLAHRVSGPADATRWPRLSGAAHVTWGTVDAKAWGSTFGAALTPTVFVFRDGRLDSMFRGHTGRPALLRATGGGPEDR